MDIIKRVQIEQLLIDNLKLQLNDLIQLQTNCNLHCNDLWYRFYHQSFKVYALQNFTTKIIEKFKNLLPDVDLNIWFLEIVKEGTGKKFSLSHNENWLIHTRPIIEAYCHAKKFLDMLIYHANMFDEPPQIMPGSWGLVLYLYNIR